MLYRKDVLKPPASGNPSKRDRPLQNENLGMAADGSATEWSCDDITWSSETCSPRTLVEKYSKHFPMLALVTRGVYGQCEEQTLGSEQILRLQDWGEQQRLVARDAQGRHLSIPAEYPLKCVVCDSRGDGGVLTLREILTRCELPVRVRFEDSSKGTFFIGTAFRGAHEDLGELTLLGQYKERFLKANAIVRNNLHVDTVLVLPMYVDILLSRATGLKGQADEKWVLQQAHFSQQVAALDFHSVQGNMDIMIYPDSVPSGDYESAQPEEYIRNTMVLALGPVTEEARLQNGPLLQPQPQSQPQSQSQAQPQQPQSQPYPEEDGCAIYEDPDVVLARPEPEVQLPPKLPPRTHMPRRGSGPQMPDSSSSVKDGKSDHGKPRKRTSHSVGPITRSEYTQLSASPVDDSGQQRGRIYTKKNGRHSPIDREFNSLVQQLQTLNTTPALPTSGRPQNFPGELHRSRNACTLPPGRNLRLNSDVCDVSSNISSDGYAHLPIRKTPEDRMSQSPPQMTARGRQRSRTTTSVDSPTTSRRLISEPPTPVRKTFTPQRPRNPSTTTDYEYDSLPSITNSNFQPPRSYLDVPGSSWNPQLSPTQQRLYINEWDPHMRRDSDSTNGSQKDDVELEDQFFRGINEVPRDISELDVQQVAQCLRMLNMYKYVQVFVEGQIDGALLWTLNDDDLRDSYGMNKVEAKKLVMFARDGWRPKLGRRICSDSTFSEPLSL